MSIKIEILHISKMTNNSSFCVISLKRFDANFKVTVDYRPIILPQRCKNELQRDGEGREIFLPVLIGAQVHVPTQGPHL